MLCASFRRTVSAPLPDHRHIIQFRLSVSLSMPLVCCVLLLELLMLECPSPGLSDSCCNKPAETTKDWVLRRLHLLHNKHWWLDEHIALPTAIKKGGTRQQSLFVSQCPAETLKVTV